MGEAAHVGRASKLRQCLGGSEAFDLLSERTKMKDDTDKAKALTKLLHEEYYQDSYGDTLYI